LDIGNFGKHCKIGCHTFGLKAGGISEK